MKAQAKLEGPVHESFVLSHIGAANAQLSLHIRTVSSQPLLLELKKAMQMKVQVQLCPF